MTFSHARLVPITDDTGTGLRDGSRWLAADEWFSQFLAKQLTPRRVRLLKEELLEKPWDYKIRALREYDAETDNLRRFIAGQKENDAG